MLLETRLQDWSPLDVRRALDGLPVADGYRLLVKPLRYRTGPSLKALCDFEDKLITLQVPDPWRPFEERVPYRARRVPGARGFRFQWEVAMVPFETRRDVVRFLYLHEYYHWYLREILGRKSQAETACDRYALAGFRERQVEPPPGAPHRWLA